MKKIPKPERTVRPWGRAMDAQKRIHRDAPVAVRHFRRWIVEGGITHYFDIYVTRRRWDMWRLMAQHRPSKSVPKCSAACWFNTSRIGLFDAKPYAPQRRAFALYFNRKDLDWYPAEIISHECAHGAMQYARIMGRTDILDKDEEEYVTDVGLITQKVSNVIFGAMKGTWP